MIVAGFGFRSGACIASLEDAYARAGGRADRIATAADKARARVFRDFAAARGLPVCAVAPGRLESQSTATRSATVMAHRGTGSVAEAAALAAAGPGATLIAPRHLSGDRMASCALAERADP